VRSTREIGIVKVLRFYRKSRKLWRIEFVAGNRALRALNELLKDYWESIELLPRKDRPLLERVLELKEGISKLEGRLETLRRELWRWKGLALLGSAKEVGDYKVVSSVEEWSMKDAQAFAVNFVKENPGVVLLLASEGYALFARNEEVGVSMRELFKRVAERLGGKGGGTDNFARGRLEAEPETVLKVAGEVLEELISGSRG